MKKIILAIFTTLVVGFAVQSYADSCVSDYWQIQDKLNNPGYITIAKGNYKGDTVTRIGPQGFRDYGDNCQVLGVDQNNGKYAAVSWYTWSWIDTTEIIAISGK